jgi:hypothetical protein
VKRQYPRDPPREEAGGGVATAEVPFMAEDHDEAAYREEDIDAEIAEIGGERRDPRADEPALRRCDERVVDHTSKAAPARSACSASIVPSVGVPAAPAGAAGAPAARPDHCQAGALL